LAALLSLLSSKGTRTTSGSYILGDILKETEQNKKEREEGRMRERNIGV
jgi:hypothetical protein